MTKRKPRKLPVPPSGFYAMARRNLEGVKRIVHTLASDTERNSDPCVQFLLGWSIEGFLMTFTFVWPSRAVPVLDALDEAVWPCVEAHFASLLVAQGKPLHPGWRPALG